jgi:hypothetical protein
MNKKIRMSKNHKKDFVSANRRALEATVSLMKILTDAGAIIGRDDSKIVLCYNRIPETFQYHDVHQINLQGNGLVSVFRSFSYSKSENIAFIDFLELTAKDDDGGSGVVFRAATNAEFPCIEEVRLVIKELPVLSEYQKTKFDIQYKSISDSISELITSMTNHERASLLAAMFSGSDADEESEKESIH